MRILTRGLTRRVAVVGFVLLAVFGLAACEVAVRVDIDVASDGSGEVGVVVELDEGAVAALAPDAVAPSGTGTGTSADTGDDETTTPGQDIDASSGALAALEAAVRLDDLAAAGWAPTWEHHDNGATLRLTKAFASPEDLPGVIAELSGPAGPLRDISLTRDDGVLSTDFAFDGTADLIAPSFGIADDEEFAAALVNERVDVAALEQSLSESLAEAMTAEVSVSLPGRGIRVFPVEPGTSVDLATSSTQWDVSAIAWWVAAGLFTGLAVVVVVAGRRNRHNRGRGTPVRTS